MKKAIGFYPCPDIDTAGTQVISHAGTALLTETIGKFGLDLALSQVLEQTGARHRGPRPPPRLRGLAHHQ